MTKSRFLEAEFRIGEWLIQPQMNSIVRADRSVNVEPKVMEVMACLAEQAGQVIPEEALIQRVWADTFVTDDVLIRAISELRRAFDDDSKNPSIPGPTIREPWAGGLDCRRMIPFSSLSRQVRKRSIPSSGKTISQPFG